MQRTVLIVDDHAAFRRLARRALEGGGFVVVGEASDGASVLPAVAALQPEVVLLDVLLPDTDGFAVADLLSSQPFSPLVVLTSSRERVEFGARLDRPSAPRFLPKSAFSSAALRTLLEIS